MTETPCIVRADFVAEEVDDLIASLELLLPDLASRSRDAHRLASGGSNEMRKLFRREAKDLTRATEAVERVIACLERAS